MNQIQWNTPDITLHASAKYTQKMGANIQLAKVQFEHKATELVVNQIELDEAYFKVNSDALFSLSDTNVIVNPDNEWEATRGAIRAQGISLYRINDELLGESISGSATFQNNQLRVETLTDGNISIQGTLSTDFETNTYAFHLQGEGDLQPEYWQTFAPAELISTLGGTVHLEHASGTYIQGEGIPEDLSLEGTFKNGQISFEQQGLLNTLSPIAARFSSTAQEIKMTLNGTSNLSGPIDIEGTYAMDEKSWKGKVRGNVQEWVEPFIHTDNQTALIHAALSQLGEPNVHLEIDLKNDGQIDLAMALESKYDASLKGSVSWIEKDSGFVLEDIHAESTFNSTPVAESLFEKMYLEGPAHVTFNRSLSKATFETNVFLDSVNVYLSEYIEKKPGDSLTVILSGEASDLWALDVIQINCLNEMLRGEYSEGKLSIPETTIQAVNWMPLLPKGSTANGAVQIGYAGESKETSMQFEQFGFQINDDLQIDRIDGKLILSNGLFQTPGLSIHGVNSDCTITAILKDDVWNGYLEGDSLDVDAVNVFLDAGRAFSVKEDTENTDGLPSESEPTSYWEKPYRIEARIRLAELLYGKGRVEQINGSLRADHTGIYLEDFVIDPKSGSLNVSASITPDELQQDQFTLHADFEQFDTHVLDTMLFNSTRELNGKISGEINFNAPRGPVKEMLTQGNGQANWVAQEGTFGKMGFATKLLTALKTVNIINLRLPSLRDKGLTYTRFSGNAEMQNGVVQFHDTLLNETSYAMEIDGYIDYAQDETHVNTFVRVLESVTNLAKKLPIIRIVAEKTTEKIGVNIDLTGSPYELKASVLGPSVSGPIGKPVNTTVKLGTDAVKGIGNVIKKPFKRNETPENEKP